MLKKTIYNLTLLTLLLLFYSNTFAQHYELKKLDITLENVTYPFDVKYIQFESQNQSLKMAYMDVVPDNPNGKNIILFHGKNFNGAYWETTAKRLVKSGYRVIIPDQIGFGKSSKPKSYQYTFQQLAINTKMIVDKLEIKQTAVLGHSMGGMLATRFTLMYPELVHAFILENPIGLEDWKLKVPYKEIDFWYQKELEKDFDSIKNYQLQSYYDGKWKNEYDAWVNLLAGWTLNKNYPLIAWNAALTFDMIFTQPVLYEFKNIHCPTLLIIGTRDRTALGKHLVSESVRKTMGRYNELGKKTQKAIPNAKLIELEDTGHLPHIECFEAFIKPLLSFLNNQ